jgi:hypothetical protein
MIFVFTKTIDTAVGKGGITTKIPDEDPTQTPWSAASTLHSVILSLLKNKKAGH